jgi:hypothetical protein
MASLYDPVEKYGTAWNQFNDGSQRKVVISKGGSEVVRSRGSPKADDRPGRYCFLYKKTEAVIPIANAISPQARYDMLLFAAGSIQC